MSVQLLPPGQVLGLSRRFFETISAIGGTAKKSTFPLAIRDFDVRFRRARPLEHEDIGSGEAEILIKRPASQPLSRVG